MISPSSITHNQKAVKEMCRSASFSLFIFQEVHNTISFVSSFDVQISMIILCTMGESWQVNHIWHIICTWSKNNKLCKFGYNRVFRGKLTSWLTSGYEQLQRSKSLCCIVIMHKSWQENQPGNPARKTQVYTQLYNQSKQNRAVCI